MFTISLQEFSHKVEESHRGIKLNQLFNLYRAKLASVSEAGKMDYFIGCLQPCIKTVGSFFLFHYFAGAHPGRFNSDDWETNCLVPR